MVLSELVSHEIEKAKKEATMSIQDYYNAAKEFNKPPKAEEVVGGETQIQLLTCNQAKKMIQNRVDECVADICTEIVKAISTGARSIEYPVDKAYELTVYIRKVVSRLEELGYTASYHSSNNSISVSGWL